MNVSETKSDKTICNRLEQRERDKLNQATDLRAMERTQKY